MPEHPMRLHPLAPEVKCPNCGAGLAFVRVRAQGDLYRRFRWSRANATSCTTRRG